MLEAELGRVAGGGPRVRRRRRRRRDDHGRRRRCDLRGLPRRNICAGSLGGSGRRPVIRACSDCSVSGRAGRRGRLLPGFRGRGAAAGAAGLAPAILGLPAVGDRPRPRACIVGPRSRRARWRGDRLKADVGGERGRLRAPQQAGHGDEECGAPEDGAAELRRALPSDARARSHRPVEPRDPCFRPPGAKPPSAIVTRRFDPCHRKRIRARPDARSRGSRRAS
jgi:hypothetical protein